MENTENINRIFRDEIYELTSINNETQNTTMQIFKQIFLIKKAQLKKCFFTGFIVSHQRNPNFFNPDQFGVTRIFQIQF